MTGCSETQAISRSLQREVLEAVSAHGNVFTNRDGFLEAMRRSRYSSDEWTCCSRALIQGGYLVAIRMLDSKTGQP